MKYEIHEIDDRNFEAMEALQNLYTFSGTPAEFWREYIRVCTEVVHAASGLLTLKDEEEKRWKTFCVWPAGNHAFIRHA
jgi:hypothetical protein